VSVLSAEQWALSERFASKADEHLRFLGLPLAHVPGARSPLLAGAVMHLDCQLQAAHEAGDHLLCVGSVQIALAHAGEPLLFHGSRYHRLGTLG
jgi:flavin reductase (DIM6/NTAB) family NADH-FMN oxidoreductase RutF